MTDYIQKHPYLVRNGETACAICRREREAHEKEYVVVEGGADGYYQEVKAT